MVPFKFGAVSPITLFCLFVYHLGSVLGYNLSGSDNLAVYYGQNSLGAVNSNLNVWQKSLASYCQDDVINAFPLAFMTTFFSAGGMPEINLANTCNTIDGAFSGTNLADCQFMAEDIKACQDKGKIITLSLGGATGTASFSSDAQAKEFAKTVWNLFLGGSSPTRPFGDAILDGIDLDLEGGSSSHYATFVTTIRSLAKGASKRYFITAAPQCPFPDAYLGSIIDEVEFDALYVQVFYNNWCGLHNFNNADAWNFGVWDNWAKTISPNKDVKIFIGAPASASSAGSGYVEMHALGNIVQQIRSQYSSFGGVMLWDVSQAYENNRYDAAIKRVMTSGQVVSPGTTTTATRTRSTTTSILSATSRSIITTSVQSTTTTSAQSTTSQSITTTSAQSTTSTSTSSQPSTSPTTGSCEGVAEWSATIEYTQGALVTYNEHLWCNLWWSCGDVPGGSSGVWMDKGACES